MRRTLIGKEKVKRVATGKRLGSLRRMVSRRTDAGIAGRVREGVL